MMPPPIKTPIKIETIICQATVKSGVAPKPSLSNFGINGLPAKFVKYDGSRMIFQKNQLSTSEMVQNDEYY